MDIDRILNESSCRRQEAMEIISELDLPGSWGRFGRPVVVGAVAYDLVFDNDIDMEIYCPMLRLEDGFQVLSDCCRKSDLVRGCSFQNHLDGPDGALYWQLSISYKGQNWKIDMWSAPEDYSLPRSETFVGPMVRALTPETRKAILNLKWHRSQDSTLQCPSIDLYRAVLRDRVRTPDGFREWLETHTVGELSAWIPQTD